MARGRWSSLALAAVLGTLGARVQAQDGGGADMGTKFVPLQVVIIGPVIPCGQVRLPSGTRYSGLNGCPAAIEVIPGYYDPVPMRDWELVRNTRLYTQVYRYECVTYRLLGFLPITVSQECIGPQGPEPGNTFVLSWEARPKGMEDPKPGGGTDPGGSGEGDDK